MADRTDFYLVSSESDLWRGPRRAKVRGQFDSRDRSDARIVDIDPPVNGQAYGQVGDISQVVLVPRHQGETLDRASDLPVAVHIALVGEEADERELDNVAWGEVIWDLAELSLP